MIPRTINPQIAGSLHFADVLLEKYSSWLKSILSMGLAGTRVAIYSGLLKISASWRKPLDIRGCIVYTRSRRGPEELKLTPGESNRANHRWRREIS